MNSMTGFGKASVSTENYSLTVEIKSVNHRFLDVSFKIPPFYAQCESRLLKEIRDNVKRGHLDVFIVRKNTASNYQETSSTYSVNEFYLTNYLAVARQVIATAKANEADVIPLVLANLIDKRELTKMDEDTRVTDELTAGDQDLVLQTVKTALRGLLEQRRDEGKNLTNVLRELFSEFESVCGQIQRATEKVPHKFHERLKSRLQNLAPDVDVSPERIAQEVAILADRLDVTEEHARLGSHRSAFATTAGFNADSADKSDECGRKMDFLIQEMGREINTIGSKAQDSEVGHLVVDAKAILEKIREQVQNIE